MIVRPGYAVAAVVVFGVEVLIALFVHDDLIRPYVGDALAVVLVYLALRGTTSLKVAMALATALAIAAAVEIAQLFHLLDALGLRENRLARVVLGGTFDLHDFVAYGLGAVAIIAVETLRATISEGSRDSTD